MKNAAAAILFLIITGSLFGQVKVRRSSEVITVEDGRLIILKTFTIPVANDTTLNGGLDSVGTVMYSRTHGGVFIRVPKLVGSGNYFVRLWDDQDLKVDTFTAENGIQFDDVANRFRWGGVPLTANTILRGLLLYSTNFDSLSKFSVTRTDSINLQARTGTARIEVLPNMLRFTASTQPTQHNGALTVNGDIRGTTPIAGDSSSLAQTTAGGSRDYLRKNGQQGNPAWYMSSTNGGGGYIFASTGVTQGIINIGNKFLLNGATYPVQIVTGPSAAGHFSINPTSVASNDIVFNISLPPVAGHGYPVSVIGQYSTDMYVLLANQGVGNLTVPINAAGASSIEFTKPGTVAAKLGYSPSLDAFVFGWNNWSGPDFRINRNGDIGTGGDPLAKFHVFGRGLFGSASGYSGAFSLASLADHDFATKLHLTSTIRDSLEASVWSFDNANLYDTIMRQSGSFGLMWKGIRVVGSGGATVTPTITDSTISYAVAISGSGFGTGSLVIISDADYTVAAGVTHVLYSTLTAGRTVTLPSAASSANRVIVITHGGSGASLITFSATLRQNVSTTTTTLAQSASYTIMSDGSQWWILSIS